jgi:E1-E2 ATPase
VLVGTSSVNQAPVTGESVPVEKQPGDTIFAGSINGEGALEVRATKTLADNTIARIIVMVFIVTVFIVAAVPCVLGHSLTSYSDYTQNLLFNPLSLLRAWA